MRKILCSFKICKTIKKGWKISIIVLAVFITILAGIAVALQNSWVQTRITQRVASLLSKHFNTEISIGHVEISLFGRLQFEDILIRDQQQDTLIYSHLVTANIDSLRLRKHFISVDELTFNTNRIKVERDSARGFNFNFLLENLNNSSKASPSPSAWNIGCRSFSFEKMNITYIDNFVNGVNNYNIDDFNLNITGFRSNDGDTRFKINEFTFREDNFLDLENFTGDFHINSSQLDLNNVNLESSLSTIEDASVKIEFPTVRDSVQVPMNLDILINKSHLHFSELSKVFPELEGMDQIVNLSGQIYGTLQDLKGKDISIETGQETKAVLDFYVNEPEDPENMYLFLDLKELQTSFSDLSGVRLPNSSNSRYITFPEGFTESGLLNFKGNFSGFLTDFVTYGTLTSEMGILSTDILVVPNKDGTIYYRGNVSTENFNLKTLFKNNALGDLTFSGSVDGNYDEKGNNISGVFKGDIKKIDLNSYTYQDISFDGLLRDKMFDGVLAINDTNLQFSFIGQMDFNSKIPDFDFLLDLKKAKLGILNLSTKFPNAELSCLMSANFSGNRLDNMDGQIRIEEGSYKNRNGEMDLRDVTLKTSQNSDIKTLSFTSPYADFEVEGTYHFSSILNAVEKTFSRFIPSYVVAPLAPGLQNEFEYKLNVKEINSIAKVLVPGIEFETPFLLYGKLDSKEQNFELEGSIPQVKYGSIMARNIFIGNKVVGDHYASKFRFGEFHMNNQIRIYNFKIDSRIANDKIDNTISWSNYDEITNSGEINTHTNFTYDDSTQTTHIEIDGDPSVIYVNDTAWFLSPFHSVIDTSSISIQNLELRNNDQYLLVEGTIHKGQTDAMNVDVRNFQLGNLDTYLKQELEITGVANGTFSFTNLLDNPAVLSDLTIDKLTYEDQLMGDVTLSSKWSSDGSVIDSKLNVNRRGKIRLDATGYYEPSTKALNFNAHVDSVSLIVLETFIGGSLTNFQGYGSGNVNIGGTTDKILMNGALMGSGAGLTVDVTQVPYTFNDSVYFRNDTILFDHITVYDELNNTGIFNGTIVHDNFSDTRYDLHLTTDKILAINTTSSDYEEFYGVGMAKGKLDITGRGKNISLNGSVTTLKGTDLSISMEEGSEAEQYDFIEFVKDNNDENSKIIKNSDESSNLHIVFAVEATPDAKVQLIYNSQIGDIIKAQGEGILVFEMNEDGDISLSGNYHPTKGDYLFTLRNVINKRFSIEQGGSIVWSGDPYNANIDLKAIYKLKASLYDLLPDYTNVTQNQRVQVECIIHLENELVNPTISFEINIPNIEESLKDEVQQYFSTEDDLNKQMLSLIILGKFYTPEYKRGIYEAQNTNMLGTTASELFSNQLSNWLSKINDNWDVGVNYRPGNQVTDDEIELALSTQIFNDRVTLNGNIGNNANQYNTNSSQIVGDFEINVKLVPSGKLQFKAYNRSNNNLIYETAPYTQGVGVSVTEEYNTLQDLWRKITNIFRRKDKKLPMTAEASGASN